MNETTTPLVSIIVPVYNAEAYLNQCIDSLINQTYKNIEIILVNDGSTDNSGKICDEYVKADTRVKDFHLANAGVSNARNIGIKNAKGEYIMFLDSDDWIDTETCEVAIKQAKETDADIVFWSWINENKNVATKERYLELNSNFLITNDIDKLKIRCIGLLDTELKNPTKTDYYNTSWAKLYKTAFLRRSNILFKDKKEVGSEDSLFNIEIFQLVDKVTYIPKYFYHYRRDNPYSLSKIDAAFLQRRFKSSFAHIEDIVSTNPGFKEALNNRKCTSLINIMLSITNPRTNETFNDRLKSTKQLLYDNTYILALNNFNTKYLSIHWKIFFTLAKFKQAYLLLLITYLMRRIR